MMPLKMPYLREEDGTNPSINVCFILIIEDQLICKNIIRSFSFDFVTSNPKCSTYGIWEDIDNKWPLWRIENAWYTMFAEHGLVS
jgi:hypothetical protein